FSCQHRHLLDSPKAAPAARVEPSRRATGRASTGTCFALGRSAVPVGSTARCASRRRPMQTLRRTAAVLTFPALAYLGAACERMDTPTEARPKVLAQFSQPVDLVVDDDGLAIPTDCNALTPTFPSINLAIMAASPGQKIGVCPGVYNEMVSINKDKLTLLGAKSGVDARTRVFVLTDESVINNTCGPVQIMANNDVLDGFTVQGSTMSDPCFIAGIWSNPGFSATQGGHT